jgi:hypothetical protein
MKKRLGVFLFVLAVAILLYVVLRPKRPEGPNGTTKTSMESTVDQIKEPAWWAEVSTVPEKTWIFTLFKVQATITPADAVYLEQIVEQRNGQELQRAAAILTAMLRGRFPAIMSRRETLAGAMLTLAKDGYPESDRARFALTILTYADRETASQFIQSINFTRPIPVEYRETIAQQLSAIGTDASIGKLNQLLAAQNDSKLDLLFSRRTASYVPVEELGQRWQKDHDIRTLNRLTSEWIGNIYEGYPLSTVVAIMGQPQRSGPHYAYYPSKEGPELYLEINDSGQVGGRDGPR